MINSATILMAIKVVNRLLQFIVPYPIVIALAESDILTFYFRENIFIENMFSFTILICLLKYWLDYRIPFCIISDNLLASVNRSIIMNNNLIFKGSILGNDSIKGISDITLVVITRYNHREANYPTVFLRHVA